MPSFKPKSAKKMRVCKKYTTTLDGKHKEFLNEFDKNEFDIIPKLKQERELLNQQLEHFDKSNIEQIMDAKDRIKEINILIKELKDKKNNYFLDNSKYIFEYFENKKNITNIDPNSTSKPSSSKNQLLFNFFKIQNDDKDTNITENRNKNIVLQPCLHFCMCEVCMETLSAENYPPICPICRVYVINNLKVYG